ncbi:YbhB/YbcL family Raf kinase inhibitor-like protein [Micromonospora sp. NPDC049679]|uniref:YbhB/YbcL family Raf kinase inhibitor-like protein n=1 Tax=Micromonospora sp. NPDC049679 TaxID=3155920 RepID=UPI0033C22480
MADLLYVRSTAFNDHDLMPDRMSRSGGNVSPPLEWSGVPDAATELVLLVEDPDAGRTPSLHWLVTGIDPATDGMAEGEVPAGGREWTNSYGATGWGGPQPPLGDDPHRYFFRLYALKKPLSLPETPQATDVHRAVQSRELASGNMVATFGR